MVALSMIGWCFYNYITNGRRWEVYFAKILEGFLESFIEPLIVTLQLECYIIGSKSKASLLLTPNVPGSGDISDMTPAFTQLWLLVCILSSLLA